MKKAYVLFVVLMLIAVPCFARLFGRFNGLDNLINKSDAIVVARIENTSGAVFGPDGWETRRCMIYQSLKGDIAADKFVTFRLANSNFLSFPSAFTEGTSYVLFLRKVPKKYDISYQSISQEGDNIELSPLGNEKKPEGSSVKERIQTLIRNYIAYRDQKAQRENKLLDKMLQ